MNDVARTGNRSVNPLDAYERRARLTPALLTILALVPGAAAWGVAVSGWVETLVGGGAVALLLSVLLAHGASLAGNRFQEKLWHDWPNDSPTNQWLNPFEEGRSAQQRAVWHAAVKRLTGLDIEEASASGDRAETARVVNDAVTALRGRLRGRGAFSDLTRYNTDYAFARNLGGLRVLWLPGSVASLAAAIGAYLLQSVDIVWPVLGVLVLIISVLLAATLPRFVKQKADRYAEAFFAAVSQLDQEDPLSTVSSARPLR